MTHYLAISKGTEPREFCAATPSEPVRGTAETHEGRMPVVYWVGALTHKACTSALVVDVPASVDDIRAFMRRAMQQAFPGSEAAHVDEDTDALLQLAAEHPIGSRVYIRVSAPTRRGDDFDSHYEVLAPDARDRALAAQQAPWTQAFLDGSAVPGGDTPPRRVG